MLHSSAIRRHFPHTKESVYFNTAANGPLPAPAYKIIGDHFYIAKMARVGAQADMFEALNDIRGQAASIFGCHKKEAGFGFNTTFGINLAAFGLPLKKGDEVLLGGVEFPANVYPWLELRNRGLKIKFLQASDGHYDLESIRRAITKKTKALSLSFVQYFNGYKYDMAAIGQLCKDNGIYFVMDAIQGAGCEPIKVKKWQVDIASSGAQKWLLASQGCGIFYISREIQKKIIPPWRSWLGVDWKCDWTNLNDFNRQIFDHAGRFELGTYPTPTVMGLQWSLDFLLKQKIADIQSHNHQLLDILIDYLQTDKNYRITSSLDKNHRSSILCFTTTKRSVADLHGFLTRKRIMTALREGSIRVSVHLFNNKQDIEQLIKALQQASRKK